MFFEDAISPIRLGEWEAERIATDIMVIEREATRIKNGKCIVEWTKGVCNRWVAIESIFAKTARDIRCLSLQIVM